MDTPEQDPMQSLQRVNIFKLRKNVLRNFQNEYFKQIFYYNFELNFTLRTVQITERLYIDKKFVNNN